MVYERGESPGGGSPLCSSPLARGTLTAAAAEVVERGLIPAHAGNTSRGLRLAPAVGAHPRSRGEHQLRLVLVRL